VSVNVRVQHSHVLRYYD